jgi:hypothetical protein
MAPELAIGELTSLKPNSIVLDPMAGSGTVIRHASELGLRALGFDMDPLAVLMASVWTTPVESNEISSVAAAVLKIARSARAGNASLPWMEDEETAAFVKYWFGLKQRRCLKRLAYALYTFEARHPENQVTALNVVKLALSRIIVTKEKGASLARDTSHSRPHKVATKSDYDVFAGFEQAINNLSRLLLSSPPKGNVKLQLGDARSLTLRANSVDAVVTSPPYLNAIDYMRGHRLALVWLGYRLRDLRTIRSESIGAERGPSAADTSVQDVARAMANTKGMENRHRAMIDRYAQDVSTMMAEIARVLKPNGKAVLVVGNSCLKGTFIRNSEGVARAGERAGLIVTSKVERDLPERSRYLPLTSGPLSKRMRTETVLTFTKN